MTIAMVWPNLELLFLQCLVQIITLSAVRHLGTNSFQEWQKSQWQKSSAANVLKRQMENGKRHKILKEAFVLTTAFGTNGKKD